MRKRSKGGMAKGMKKLVKKSRREAAKVAAGHKRKFIEVPMPFTEWWQGQMKTPRLRTTYLVMVTQSTVINKGLGHSTVLRTDAELDGTPNVAMSIIRFEKRFRTLKVGDYYMVPLQKVKVAKRVAKEPEPEEWSESEGTWI